MSKKQYGGRAGGATEGKDRLIYERACGRRGRTGGKVSPWKGAFYKCTDCGHGTIHQGKCPFCGGFG